MTLNSKKKTNYLTALHAPNLKHLFYPQFTTTLTLALRKVHSKVQCFVQLLNAALYMEDYFVLHCLSFVCVGFLPFIMALDFSVVDRDVTTVLAYVGTVCYF